MSKGKAGTSDATRLIRSGRIEGVLSNTVGPAIQRGSTVLMPDAASLYDNKLITYGREGLSTQNALKAALCEMEGAVGCQLFPSGVASVTGPLLAVLKAGDRLLVSDCAYNPTRRFCDHVLKRFGVDVAYFSPRASAEEIMALGGPNLAAILIESPGSLTFEITDVAAVAALARTRGVITLVDNTWAAGLLFKPLQHGADISIQALTKYVGGHSDVFMGSACAGTAAMKQKLDDAVVDVGWSVSPDDAYQMLRGLRTLPTRLARHGESGLTVANWLREQPQVAEVLHPAMPHSEDHALWKRDYTGTCGLFGVVLKPAPETAVNAFLDSLTLFGLGFSWGGFESLAIPSDSQVAKRRLHAPLAGPLVRIHIGLEDPADLIADLIEGFAALDAAR
jgi:cysteine-S-conjugate beta-lyase